MPIIQHRFGYTLYMYVQEQTGAGRMNSTPFLSSNRRVRSDLRRPVSFVVSAFSLSRVPRTTHTNHRVVETVSVDLITCWVVNLSDCHVLALLNTCCILGIWALRIIQDRILLSALFWTAMVCLWGGLIVKCCLAQRWGNGTLLN